MKIFAYWLLLFSILTVAACTTTGDNTAPDPNGAILVGDNAISKRLVTVVLTPTPPEGVAERTPVPTFELPTDFPIDDDPTFTPTAIIGVFVGTAVNGTPESVAIVPIDGGGISVSNAGVSVPIDGTTVAGAAGNCPFAVSDTFREVYTRNSAALQTLGCPTEAGQTINLVYQSFERGKMFWRNTLQIYVLQPNASLLIVADGWQEGMPASDDAYVPPSGNLFQPVRGFGFVWRNNESIRNNIGWATQGESPIPSFWQSFENGALFIGDGGAVYAIVGSTSTYLGPL